MVNKIFFIGITLLFICSKDSFAQGKYLTTGSSLSRVKAYQTIGQSPIFDRVIEYSQRYCKESGVVDFLCEEYSKGKIVPGDYTFDCNIKRDECAPGEKVEPNNEKIKFRYVVSYHFENTGTCVDSDQNNGDESFVDNAKLIFKSGIEENLPFSKISEGIRRYLSTPYSDGRGGKISRAHCLKVKKGWVMEHSLTKYSFNDLVLNTKTQVSECVECGSELKTPGKQKYHVKDLNKRILLEEKLIRESNREKIQACEGNISFANISFELSKGADKSCSAIFPKECGKGPAGNLELIEQISNGIFLSLGGYSKDYEKFCTPAINSFVEKCGLSKLPIREATLEKFSKVREQLNWVLANERKGSGIKEETMMCIFKKETMNYDGSKVNTDGCGPRNINNIRNPYFNDPSLHDPDEFVFKGWVSSASGLGMVTLETTCATIRKYPEHYGDISRKINGLLCSSPEAKKLVENYFISTGQVEAMQIRISIDALRMKMSETNNSLGNAVFNYGDGTKSYGEAVHNCEKCFSKEIEMEVPDAKNKDKKIKIKKIVKATDEQAFECLHPSKKNMATVKSQGGA